MQQTRKSQSFLRALAWLALCCPAVGCGGVTPSVDLGESLTVAMTGVFEAPADATGNAEPKSMAMTLTGVALTAVDGSTVDLFAAEEAEPTEYRIISRGQIVFEADISDYVDVEFAALTVTFDPTVQGQGKYEDEMTTTLTSTTAAYAEPFTVENAKAVELGISVQWKNIVTRDEDADPPTEVMSSPGLVADLAGG